MAGANCKQRRAVLNGMRSGLGGLCFSQCSRDRRDQNDAHDALKTVSVVAALVALVALGTTGASDGRNFISSGIQQHSFG